MSAKEIDVKNHTIIDVRSKEEFAAGHLPRSKNIELSKLLKHPEILDKNHEYYIICASGMRSGKACRILTKQGYQVINIKGGIMGYKAKLV
ncbi:rhodanese-like domain-containing protein [Culicoidibacter larvae]|uniref:Rhodanese-like domain-containing protein n=1 Tax=Culicoidibacter larvae TaxID=2579976 RepID=A0A5R8QE33_9FIRM|nr:rhodanese-like domain-containing protein [Culicoidibacter larvae]